MLLTSNYKDVLKILHCFADRGAENPSLSNYGEIVRMSIDVTENKWSIPIQADMRQLPLDTNVKFDIGWFHPPCGGVSPMSTAFANDSQDWPDYIPLSREIAQKHCTHHIIENKPRKSLNPEVILTGHMFNLGIEYKRGFETSFEVKQPANQSKLAETTPFYSPERTREWWAGVKGSSVHFPKDHLAKNTIPSAYINYLMRYHALAIEPDDTPDYSNYDKDMETSRRKDENIELSSYE